MPYRARAEVEAHPLVPEPELPDEEPGPMVGRGSGVVPGERRRVTVPNIALAIVVIVLMLAGSLVLILRP